MKKIELHPKYDVTDFRSEDMRKIEELLNGTEDFRIDIESTKELVTAQIYGNRDGIDIRVEWCMDDLCDLVDDALCANEQEVESNKEWDELMEAVENEEVYTVCAAGETIGRDTNLRDLIKSIESVSHDAYTDLDAEWSHCKAIVRDFVNERRK